MFDELWPSDLLVWLIAAMVMAGGLALLPKSKPRLWLIAIWTLVPLVLSLIGFVISMVNNPGALTGAMGFYGAVVLFTLPPWALLTLLSFNVVRRLRDLNTGGA